MSRRAKSYRGTLSRPSMPTRPDCGTRNDYRKWLAEYRKCGARGLHLLLRHYEIPPTSIEGEQGRMLKLLNALARDHVPYFSAKKRKHSKWDRYRRARFLRDVINERKTGKLLNIAVRRAAKNLPRELQTSSNSALEKQYRISRKFFRHEVNISNAHEIVPLSPFMARLWRSDLQGPTPARGRVEIDPNNPDQMVVYFDD